MITPKDMILGIMKFLYTNGYEPVRDPDIPISGGRRISRIGDSLYVVYENCAAFPFEDLREISQYLICTQCTAYKARRIKEKKDEKK